MKLVEVAKRFYQYRDHFEEIFRDFNFLGEGKLIFTMDITSLYTVIPNGEGLLALKYFFLIYAQSRNQARKHCSAWLNYS